MREILTFVAGIIIVVSPIPYVIDIVRGRTKPNMVTWVTWSLINAINTAAAFSAGAWQTGVYGLAATIATSTISVLGLWKGVKHYTPFDITCQIIAVLGIPVWLVTKQPGLAIALELAVDMAGGLPTLRHAWRAPNEETLRTFLLSGVAGLLLLLSLNSYNFVAVAMPAYILLFDSTLASTIWWRRGGMRRPAAKLGN
jgi:hypothetical protein